MKQPGHFILPISAKSVVVSFIALTSIVTSVSASDWSDCSSGDPARTISACSAILNKGIAVPAAQRAVALLNRGIAYYDSNDLEKALADYSSAIQLNPKNAEAFHDRGDLLLRQGSLEPAIADYTEALRLNDRL